MVQWMSFTLVLCLLTQVLALISVLLSMQYQVVPKFEGFSRSWRRTRCYIKNITFITPNQTLQVQAHPANQDNTGNQSHGQPPSP